jgi:hypothetical protein
MHTSTILTRLCASLVCAAGVTNAGYTLQDNYDHTNFFTEFNFFDAPDPTNGFVNYASATAANLSSLAGYSNNAVYLGVDYTITNPVKPGRDSVRIHSNRAYTHGLFVADIAHMPGSTCGVWPAFWTVGQNWPQDGEIDILEGVNSQTTNSVTLHTSSGCKLESTGAMPSSKLSTSDCGSNNGFNGCGFETENTQGYGDGFNSVGGGVYAMEWTSEAIKVFFFPRSSIPSDISSGSPDTSTWGPPVASFSGSGCDIDSHFTNHNIVFDTTFCGQWAGQVWAKGECASKANTCDEFVAKNPDAYKEAYWIINSVRVYQDGSTTGKRDAEGVVPVPFLA